MNRCDKSIDFRLGDGGRKGEFAADDDGVVSVRGIEEFQVNLLFCVRIAELEAAKGTEVHFVDGGRLANQASFEGEENRASQEFILGGPRDKSSRI